MIPLFGLTLNLKNFSEEKLKNILKKFNKKIGVDDFSLELEFHEKYYKYPDEEKCIINIFSTKYISLKSILNKYKYINWKYSSTGDAFFEKDGILCFFRDEDAHWNSDGEKEFFLDPDITWAYFIAFPIEPSVAEAENFD